MLKLRHTYEDVRAELANSFVAQDHTAEALPDECEVLPCRVFDEVAFIQVHEMKPG